MGLLINIIIALVILGLLYYLVMLLPIPEPFRTVIRVVVILLLIVWLLSFAGWLPGGVWRFR